MKRSLLLTFVLLICLGVHAHDGTVRDSVLLNFRQSKTYLDTTYMHNPQALKQARDIVATYHRPDSNIVLTNVQVVGAASPEGSVRINQRLSHGRAHRIFSYMNQWIELPDSMTTFTYLGRDWNGLRRMVLADPDVPFRDDVLATLDDIVASDRNGGETESMHNLRRIKLLHDGVPYLYMYRHIFPALRESKVILTFAPAHPAMLQAIAVPPSFSPIYLPALQPIEVELPHQHSPFYMDLRTNMLFDALAVPNIGAEFYLGKQWSIVGDWMYGWWDTDRTHHYWRIYGGDVTLRYWFGDKALVKPLTGHHVGIYGGVVTYDFEWGGRGYMGGLPGRNLWDKCNYYCGLEYGYSMPLSRRLNIDFSLGIGYLGGEYREYIPIDRCYVWQATKKRHWFGPTKLEVSLVWLLGRGNFNSAKGGGHAL